MSGADYTTTPNLGLFKPNYSKDVGNWGNHLNANADTLPAIAALTVGGSMGYQQQISQWARRVRYWPRQLSQAELISVTT